MDHLTEKLIQSTPVFKGKIVDVYLDTVSLPNGHTASRDVVRHPGAVCILAITDDDKVVLVKQFRHPCGKVLLEIPAGKLDHKDEHPEQCALRELAEETPYTSTHIVHLHTFYTAAGFCDEIIHLYKASRLLKNSSLTTDEDEFLDVTYLTKEETKHAIAHKKIEDSKTLIALQHWLLEGYLTD